MARMKLEVKGLNELNVRLRKLGVNIRDVAEEALNETHSIVTKKAESEIQKHHLTGETEESLRKTPTVVWVRDLAEVKVGFDIKNGGLPSIFLMYGTPRMKKDQKLYNAFFGRNTQKEIVEKQTDIFYDAIRKGGG